MGLKFSVIQDLLEALILQHHVQVKRSLGMGRIASLLTLTESGRSRAREHLEACQYSGTAPVPLAQYAEMVTRQRPREGWLTKEALRQAFGKMVITERLLSQVGPAVSSANSLLLYGKPGDGKTFLVEQLNNLESTPVFVPYAIECQGNVIQVFDPIYHQPIAEEQPSVLTIAIERSHDRRWVKCKRPFIVSGGELSLDMLDLRHNQTSKIYEAPFQLKANNGIYLVDDFGRQRATPAEVLNRWIVPMERRVDYLSFLTGGKMTAPFETFLVFSTNLNPSSLGDEAFLRRIQYKMLLRSPSGDEFSQIFERTCSARRIPCTTDVLDRFVDKHFRRTGKPLRRCQPRDLLFHALNLIHFEKLPHELNDEILDRAFESCFVEDEETQAPQASVKPDLATQAARIPTVFGRLCFLAEQQEKSVSSEERRTLARLHVQLFQDWLGLTLELQSRDLTDYIAVAANRASIEDHRAGFIERLTPAGSVAAEAALFAHGLNTLLDMWGLNAGVGGNAATQSSYLTT
jgi:hypothetical protein